MKNLKSTNRQKFFNTLTKLSKMNEMWRNSYIDILKHWYFWYRISLSDAAEKWQKIKNGWFFFWIIYSRSSNIIYYVFVNIQIIYFKTVHNIIRINCQKKLLWIFKNAPEIFWRLYLSHFDLIFLKLFSQFLKILIYLI